MGYAIRIGVCSGGQPLIGADAVRRSREDGTLLAEEKVYGIQIGHRVAALIGGEWELTTPTDATRRGATRIVRFPGPCERRS